MAWLMFLLLLFPAENPWNEFCQKSKNLIDIIQTDLEKTKPQDQCFVKRQYAWDSIFLEQLKDIFLFPNKKTTDTIVNFDKQYKALDEIDKMAKMGHDYSISFLDVFIRENNANSPPKLISELPAKKYELMRFLGQEINYDF